MRDYLPIIVRAGLFLLLTFFSATILFTTVQNSRALHALAVQSLENTALALSDAAEKALRVKGEKAGAEVRQILSDRVVAYALIAGNDGTILFHTNPQLVGSQLSRKDMDLVIHAGKTIGRRIILGTGVPAYEFDFIIYSPKNESQMLRLVLHTTSADEIIARSDRMWWSVGGILLLLWTVGILFERISMRYIRLQEGMERQRQLSMIGQMTAVLAHEIRNALGSVKGYVQWAGEKMTDSVAVKSSLSLALQGTGRIESLVNDLLLFSREEAYRIEDIDLADLIREAALSSLSGWVGKIDLDALPEIRVCADREKLHRVLVNAIKNAVEAMDSSGHLHISIHKEGRWVCIRVEDSGTGIRPEAIPRLFEPFFTTKINGTGLGLAYAKKAVEGMSGTISLANRKDGNGAIMTIRLPGGRKEHYGQIDPGRG